MSSGNDDLLETIENIRQAKYPVLPADLVAQIVAIEQRFTDNRVEAYKRIGQAIDQYLIGQSI